jgi:hypothetical protein
VISFPSKLRPNGSEEDAMKLSAQQIKNFDELGYQFFPNCFSEEEVAVMRSEAEGFVIGVRGKGAARCAGLIAPDFLAHGAVDVLRFRAHDRDFFLAEAVREELVAQFVEILELLRAELHGVLLAPVRAEL